MTEELSVIGKRIPLEDATQKVTGSLKFAIDINLPGMLYGKILHSPYAHARIVKIDTSRAESLPGVAAVITYKDVPEEEWLERSFNYRGPVLDRRVRFAGDEVAAVAAQNKYIAEEALKLIEVEYEELPHVFDMEKAIEPGAPQVASHGNVRNSVVEWGDIEAGFEEADLVVETRTTMGKQQAAPLGKNACIATWEVDKLTVWTSTQTPFQLRDELARLLKMSQSKVRVIGLPTGPSFGLWWANNFHFITVFLARKAGRPVKLELTQEESFATVKRRDTPISYGKLGLKKDGSFVSIHFKHYFDNGAYGFKPVPYESVSDLWGGRTPHGRFEMYGVSTNLVTGGCMRGVGDMSMSFCMEQLMDKAAEKLNVDPLEIRLKNHIRVGDPIRSLNRSYRVLGFEPPEMTLASSGLAECIEKGAEAIGWQEKWQGWGKPTGVNGTKRRAVGMAVAPHICGGKHLGCPSVVVKINNDGSANLLTGVGRMGQGVETTQAQIAAEELGIPVENFIGTHGDTDTCPWGPPTVGSINAYQTGMATQAAAADAKRQLLQLAGEHMEAGPEELEVKNGTVRIKGQPETAVPVSKIMSHIREESLSAHTIVGQAWKNSPCTPISKIFMAHFVELEVDTESGEINILRYVAAHDSGRLINPDVCENQLFGGVLVGCGFGLIEDLILDSTTGRIINSNFRDYKILTALDTPDIEPIFVEVIDPVGPFGVKAIGEGTTCPVPAALAQAVYNAIGIRLEVPITPDKVLAALRQQRGE